MRLMLISTQVGVEVGVELGKNKKNYRNKEIKIKECKKWSQKNKLEK